MFNNIVDTLRILCYYITLILGFTPTVFFDKQPYKSVAEGFLPSTTLITWDPNGFIHVMGFSPNVFKIKHSKLA